MKALLALASLALAAPALAQTPAPAQAPAASQAAPAQTSSGALSVQTTKISEIIKNEKAKAALEKQLPPIVEYYSQIGDMTLAEVAPMSQGAIDEAKLKAIQADFDALK